MITRFGMAPRARGTSVHRFQEHWRTSHADAAGRIPNLRRYTQNHGVLDGDRYLLGYPGFDACSELDFDSVVAMEEGFASETYRTLVTADERVFVDKSRFSMMVGRKTTVRSGDGAGVKLMSFLRAHPAAGTSGLSATLEGSYAKALADAGHRHELFVMIPEGHAATPAAFEAVDILWFADRVEMRTVLASEAWAEATWELSGRASGVVRLAAVPIVVR